MSIRQIENALPPLGPTLQCSFALLLILLSSVIVRPAFAGENDRVSILQRIVVNQDETVGDLVCILCSVDVHGTVDGDIVSILGGVKGEGQMHGDLVSILGNVSLTGSATLDGQAVILGGDLNKGATVHVGESQVVLPTILLLVPFIVLGSVVWGISRLFRRRPAYFRPLR